MMRRMCSWVLLAVSSFLTTLVRSDRAFFISAVEEDWNYFSQAEEHFSTKENLTPEEGKTRRSEHIFRKVIYKEYTDASFTVEKPKPDWLGFVGPILYGEADEFINVTFFNNASRTYSVHPHGVLYNKPNEGALYADGTHDNGSYPAPDLVEPGCTYTYVWRVVEDAAPAAGDPDCLTWVYHSHVDTVRDTNSGLVGILLTCRQGALNATNLRRHYALYVTTVDESKSWYVDENMASSPRGGNNSQISSFHAINGYLYGTLPDLDACVGEVITWHMVGLGSTGDMHSLSISGHSFEIFHHRQSSISLDTAEFATATTTALVPGRWLISCNVFDHAQNGMQAFFNVRECDTLHFRPGYVTGMRTYYIAAQEVYWSYGPSGKNGIDGTSLTEPGSASEQYFKTSNTSIGGVYKKAIFRAYEDYHFITEQDDRPEHYGILGPVIRVEVGEIIQIVFKNMANRSYSLHGEGVTFSKRNEGAAYRDDSPDTNDNLVLPGQIHTYHWIVSEELGPTETDPECLTRSYTSVVDIVRDTYSGLIGPLLVCKKGRLTREGKQIDIDKEFVLLVSVNDENQSWYIEDNVRAAGINPEIKGDYSFTESNMMHGINGLMFGNLRGLNMCVGDRVSWHVLSVGTTSDLHSLYFHGNTFSRVHTHRSTTALFPGIRKTLYMTPECSGIWMLSCQTDNHFTAGEKAFYKVDKCHTKEASSSSSSSGSERVFYIQAEEVDWDYAPSGRDQVYDKDLPGSYNYKTYRKVVYRGYTDESFTNRRNESGEEYIGILGPVIRVEVGDVLKVVFRNSATQPLSFHPQGLTYKLGGASKPGHIQPDQPPVLSGNTYVYTWNVRNSSGPGISDPNCINYPYYSDVDPLRDVNTGLAGALIICKPGTLDENGLRTDVDKEFAIYFTIIDEGKSWLAEENILKCQKEHGLLGMLLGYCKPKKFYAINGFIFGNQPLPTIPQWSVVDWYLMTLGDESDLHPVHFHGNDVYLFDGKVHTDDVNPLFPGVFSTVRMHAINPGMWLFHCHVNFHINQGMEGFYLVEKRIIPLNISTADPM